MALQEGTTPLIKTGQATTDTGGRFDVVFVTPFLDKNYSIQFTPAQLCTCTWRNKEAYGFRIRTRDYLGANVPGVSVGWTATGYVDE